MKDTKIINNIYLEKVICNETTTSLWEKILLSKEFQSLFTQKTLDFTIGNTGMLHWNYYFFIKTHGEYLIESYQKDNHLLLKITANNFSSVLLITTESNKDNILLRIDHRSFLGNKNNAFYYSFLKRWKKMLSSLDSKINNK